MAPVRPLDQRHFIAVANAVNNDSITLEFKPGKEAGYDWACTKYFPGPTKYNPQDGKKVLEPIDDAARVRWGDAWRIPTAKEWSRLLYAKALRFGLECPPGIRTGGRCDGFCIRPVKE